MCMRMDPAKGHEGAALDSAAIHAAHCHAALIHNHRLLIPLPIFPLLHLLLCHAGVPAFHRKRPCFIVVVPCFTPHQVLSPLYHPAVVCNLFSVSARA